MPAIEGDAHESHRVQKAIEDEYAFEFALRSALESPNTLGSNFSSLVYWMSNLVGTFDALEIAGDWLIKDLGDVFQQGFQSGVPDYTTICQIVSSYNARHPARVSKGIQDGCDVLRTLDSTTQVRDGVATEGLGRREPPLPPLATKPIFLRRDNSASSVQHLANLPRIVGVSEEKPIGVPLDFRTHEAPIYFNPEDLNRERGDETPLEPPLAETQGVESKVIPDDASDLITSMKQDEDGPNALKDPQLVSYSYNHDALGPIDHIDVFSSQEHRDGTTTITNSSQGSASSRMALGGGDDETEEQYSDSGNICDQDIDVEDHRNDGPSAALPKTKKPPTGQSKKPVSIPPHEQRQYYPEACWKCRVNDLPCFLPSNCRASRRTCWHCQAGRTKCPFTVNMLMLPIGERDVINERTEEKWRRRRREKVEDDDTIGENVPQEPGQEEVSPSAEEGGSDQNEEGILENLVQSNASLQKEISHLESKLAECCKTQERGLEELTRRTAALEASLLQRLTTALEHTIQSSMDNAIGKFAQRDQDPKMVVDHAEYEMHADQRELTRRPCPSESKFLENRTGDAVGRRAVPPVGKDDISEQNNDTLGFEDRPLSPLSSIPEEEELDEPAYKPKLTRRSASHNNTRNSGKRKSGCSNTARSSPAKKTRGISSSVAKNRTAARK